MGAPSQAFLPSLLGCVELNHTPWQRCQGLGNCLSCSSSCCAAGLRRPLPLIAGNRWAISVGGFARALSGFCSVSPLLCAGDIWPRCAIGVVRSLRAFVSSAWLAGGCDGLPRLLRDAVFPPSLVWALRFVGGVCAGLNKNSVSLVRSVRVSSVRLPSHQRSPCDRPLSWGGRSEARIGHLPEAGGAAKWVELRPGVPAEARQASPHTAQVTPPRARQAA